MHKLTTSLITAIALFGFSACSTTDDTTTQEAASAPTTTEIRGSSTLSNATICLDINDNGSCDDADITTLSDVDGSYAMTFDQEGDTPLTLIAQDGYNLVLEESNVGRFRFITQFDENMDAYNINTITSLITQLQNEMSLEEAIADIASRYNLDAQTLLQDPIAMLGEDDANFLLIHGIELGYTQSMRTQEEEQQNAPALHRAATTESTYITPTTEESDGFLADGLYLYYDTAAYFVRIQKKIEDFIVGVETYFNNIFEDFCFTDCQAENTLERSVLTGIWGISDDQVSLCYDINAQDKLTAYVDGLLTLENNIYYSEAQAQLSLIKGWETVETYAFDLNRSNNDILFATTSNDGTLTFKRYESVETCHAGTTRISIDDPQIHPEAPAYTGLSHLEGKIVISGDKAIKNLRIFYTRASDKKILKIYGDDNGSFEFNSANDGENIWYKPLSQTIELNVQVQVENSLGIYNEVIYPITLTADQIDGYRLDLGEVMIDVAEVSFCAVDAGDPTLEYNYTILLDRAEGRGYVTQETQLGLVLKDEKEHMLYILENENEKTAVQYFRATTDTIDLTQNCLQITEQTNEAVALNIHYTSENNDTSVLLSNFSDYDSTYVLTDNSVMLNKGIYLISLRNNTDQAETMLAKTMSIDINGKTYTSLLEHTALEDTKVFIFMIVDSTVIVMTNGYQEVLTGL